MVVADDYHLEAGGEHYRFALFAFFLLCCTCGVPLSWNKTAGGETVIWVGFELLHSTHHLGISQRRAEWFTNVCHRSARAREAFPQTSVSIHVAPPPIPSPQSSALPQILPPLSGRSGIRFSALQLRSMESTTVAPRVDAQASSERTGIGGWFPHRGQDGKIDIRGSRLFSLELIEEEWPWIFARHRKPALIISTLESLVVFVALKLLYGETPRERHTRVQIVPDNRGNGALLNKLMSTKFPASAVLMELASYMRRMSLEWAPREGNKEADKLANCNAEDFDPSLRIDVSASTLSLGHSPRSPGSRGAAERQS